MMSHYIYQFLSTAGPFFSLCVISLATIKIGNPINNILFLVLVYLLTAYLFLRLGAEYLSVLLVIVYVGAVSILFLFVVMMLNINVITVYETFKVQNLKTLFIGVFFFIFVMVLFCKDLNVTQYFLYELSSQVISIDDVKKTNIHFIAQVLFNHYFVIVFLSGVLLFMAMVGSVLLTLDQNKQPISDDKSSKKINSWSFVEGSEIKNKKPEGDSSS